MKGNGHLSLAIGLGALALIRPLMNMLGLLERIGQPMASISVTILISVIWIGAAVLFRVENPLKTLLYAGIVYGGLAIIISAIASPILEGELQGPITNPFAIVSVIVTNAVWGVITGWIAAAVQRTMRRN
ncbi:MULTISPECIES: hypothetical protein [Geobacillus]|jgi:hypothetical protein|uniref:Uncharacterized protein n=2 Tax=Geobacillus thermodenitrificans TaxID=33940 RepID=A4INN4_GEOTN|nr:MULTISPECIES: hypothetical protein [Geobacillus]ABO66938.1 hypothetical protein GTNG_1570 [Geobacillus thermodenitrificans NG80-2]ARA96723.1 hypothetical protein GD3902_00905 [Geobacillus thermodenitrificans]ARP42708.1 hypothetical protein GTHT12_01157 [Geobacillus thermodenitrificans]ATO35993.1 hypothetical protein GTID1_01465 [Geobacillus thermodenitrificans]KQB93372.1 hypothetical protein GEPA3_1651 [Geobacillus sp. PA-3]